MHPHTQNARNHAKPFALSLVSPRFHILSIFLSFFTPLSLSLTHTYTHMILVTLQKQTYIIYIYYTFY